MKDSKKLPFIQREQNELKIGNHKAAPQEIAEMVDFSGLERIDE